MAAPSSTYDVATVTNPSASLSEFTLLVDLSRMSAAWWAAVDSSDGTRGRAFKDDGTTELACDWLDFNDVAETGWLRVKWSGTLSNSGTQKVRVYPPRSGNASVAAGDTYGRYNAYDSDWVGYWPLTADFADRTVNSNNGSPQGGVTAGGVIGQAGPATQFDGTDDYVSCGSGLLSSAVGTLLALFQVDDFDSDMGVMGTRSGSEDEFSCYVRDTPDNTLVATSWHGRIVSSALSAGIWYHVAGALDGGGREVYLDGASIGSNAEVNFSTFNLEFRLGTRGQASLLMDGAMQHMELHSARRSTACISHERDQLADQATFWGTWEHSEPLETTASFSKQLDDSSFSSTSSAEVGADLSFAHQSASTTITAATEVGGDLSTQSDDSTFTLVSSAEVGADLATTLDADSFSLASSVESGATVSTTLDPSTLSSSSSVEVGADLSQQLDAGTLSATASVEDMLVTADLSVNLEDSYFSSQAEVEAGATLSTTLDDSASSSTVSSEIGSSLNTTLDDSTVTLATSTDITVDFDQQLDDGLLTAIADTTDTVNASLSVSLEEAAFSSQSSSEVAAGLTATLDEGLFSSDADVEVSADLSSLLVENDFSATVSTETISVADFSATLDEATFDLQAAAEVSVSFSQQLDDNLFSSTASSDETAVVHLSAVLDEGTLSTAAGVEVGSSFSKTLGTVGFAFVGSVEIGAALVHEIDGCVHEMIVSAEIGADFVQTLDPVVFEASGIAKDADDPFWPNPATLTVTLDPAQFGLSASVEVASSFSAALDPIDFTSAVETLSARNLLILDERTAAISAGTFSCWVKRQSVACDVGYACQLTVDGELQVFPRVSGNTLLTWNLLAIEGVRNWAAPLLTAIDYAPVNVTDDEPWTELSAYSERDGFYEVPQQLLFGSDFNLHFRLRIKDAADQVYVTRPVHAADDIPARMRGTYSSLVRQWYRRARMGELRQGVLLKRKRWGTRCPDCLDRDGKHKIRTECPTCFDTHFVGGYYVASTCFPVSVINERLSEEFKFEKGYRQEGPIAQFLMLDRPQLYPGDIWADLTTDERWLLGSPMQTQSRLGNVRLLRACPAARLSSTDVVYQFQHGE